MKLKRIIRSIFPPRSGVTVRDAVPLIAFLALYAAVCLTLELTHTVLFARPMAFGLIVLTGWIWWMHLAGFSGLSRSRAQIALQTRLVLAGLFVMLMAEPRAVRSDDSLSVVYVVDISDSIRGDREQIDRTDAALSFVARTVSEKPQEDQAGLVVFGRDAAVELPPKNSFPFETESVYFNSIIEGDATNIEEALSLAAAMLPEEKRGRIVLISDGIQTEGSLTRILDELKSREVAVDVVGLNYAYEHEVWLERLELPRMVKLGEDYQAAVVLSSLQDGQGRLVLRENEQIVYDEPVTFRAGKNRYTIPIRLRQAGYYEYAATIEVPDEKDNLSRNNTVLDYIFIEGEGRVLLVTDPQGDSRDWESLERALRQSQRAVDRISAYDLSRDTLSLMTYDAILFVNVGADAFDVVQLQSVHDAVKNLGVGFLMVGGPNSFGPGGYHRTVIEDALPVTMDVTKKKVLPKGALAIVLHTCEFPQGNTWGKRITKQAIKVLGAQDEVGVLVYDFEGGESWLFELTPAGQYEKLAPKIEAAQIGDMPSFAATMQMGLAGLKKSDAAAKHMIIISDGDPSPPPPQLLQDFKDAKISVTTVSIFPHGGQEVAVMRTIAGVTGGRYYYPSDPNQLPQIFIKEAKTLKRSMIQNKTIVPEVDFPHPVLKGIDGAPPLHGYVLTTAKSPPQHRVVLRAPEDEEATGQVDPVLAIGRYGLGATAAFTSDLSTNWGKDWVDWEKYQAFVKQLMTSIARVRKQGHLRLWTYTSGNEGIIVAEDFHPEEHFLTVEAVVSGPRERSETITLKQVGPRRYQAAIPLWGKGRYQVMAAATAGERKESAIAGFIVPYSPEYLRFRSNPIVLQEIADRTGGQKLSLDAKAEQIYQVNRKPKRSSSAIFDWFLIALACLVPLDVAVRRIQLDWSVVKQWLGLGAREGASTATMGALLERKQAVQTQLEARRGEGPVRPPTTGPVSAASRRAAQGKSKPKAKPKRRQASQSEEEMTTTARLLEMKRKRRKHDEE